MKSLLFSLLLLPWFLPASTNAQNFNGFVVTTTDSLIKGYMRITLDEGGRKFLITDDKKKTPKSYHLKDLKYYALKKDTVAILRNFYPFEGEVYSVELMEADIIISKGKLKLYHGTLPHYIADSSIFIPGTTTLSRVPTGAGYGSTYGVPTGGGNITPSYTTYIIKDREGRLHAVRNSQKKFISSVIGLFEDRQDIVDLITHKKLKYKDMEEIVRLYNKKIQN